MTWVNISWQSIIAGLVASLAISIVMAVLGIALGFTVIKPTANDPTSGLGTAFGIWSVLSIIISLAVGGYVAGMFSGARGCEHGLIVWATVLLAGTLFSGIAFGSAVRMIGSAVRGVGSGAASVVGSIGSGVSDMASHAVDQIRDNVHLDFHTDDIKENVASVLRDSGIEHLQPEYLQQQMREARSDLRSAINRLRLNSDNYQEIINGYIEQQKDRLNNITQDIDRDAAVTAVMNTRDIPRAQAEQEVDNAVRVYNKAVDRAQQGVADMQRYFDETREHIQQAMDRARVRADQMASTAAKSAWMAGIALIIGAVICGAAGYYGAR